MATETNAPPTAPGQVRALMLLGGLVGLVLLIAGGYFGWRWWKFLTDWLGGTRNEGAEWRILTVVGLCLGGLAVIFAALQPARAYERTDPTLRRMLYGYNAFLAGALLFLCLVVVNLLAHTKLPSFLDSTKNRDFSLSDEAVKVIRGLDQPTKVVMLVVSTMDEGAYQLRSLMSAVKDVNPRQISVEEVPFTLNPGRARELERAYSSLTL